MKPSKPSKADEGMTERQVYNLVTDVVAGPNIRLRDNLIQGLAVLIALLLGVVLGLLVAHDPLMGALVGALLGMVIGLFLSGIYLMIYRAVKHMKGQHD
jgi:hypothetical protein